MAIVNRFEHLSFKRKSKVDKKTQNAKDGVVLLINNLPAEYRGEFYLFDGAYVPSELWSLDPMGMRSFAQEKGKLVAVLSYSPTQPLGIVPPMVKSTEKVQAKDKDGKDILDADGNPTYVEIEKEIAAVVEADALAACSRLFELLEKDQVSMCYALNASQFVESHAASELLELATPGDNATDPKKLQLARSKAQKSSGQILKSFQLTRSTQRLQGTNIRPAMLPAEDKDDDQPQLPEADLDSILKPMMAEESEQEQTVETTATELPKPKK